MTIISIYILGGNTCQTCYVSDICYIFIKAKSADAVIILQSKFVAYFFQAVWIEPESDSMDIDFCFNYYNILQ